MILKRRKQYFCQGQKSGYTYRRMALFRLNEQKKILYVGISFKFVYQCVIQYKCLLTNKGTVVSSLGNLVLLFSQRFMMGTGRGSLGG